MLTAPPTYNWDDVPEPTDADLAEIDAAISVADVVPEADDDTLWAWANSYPVRKTVELVGYPDGSTEWLIDFTSTLFAFVENLDQQTAGVDADRMYELAKSWRNADGKRSWQRGGQLRKQNQNNLREMVQAIGIEAVARYLDTTTSQVEKWMFPRAPLASLRKAQELRMAGTPMVRACSEAGVAPQTFVGWTRAWRYPDPKVSVRRNGVRVVLGIKERIMELAATETSPAAVLDILREEFAADHLTYDAVYMAMKRVKDAA